MIIIKFYVLFFRQSDTKYVPAPIPYGIGAGTYFDKFK